MAIYSPPREIGELELVEVPMLGNRSIIPHCCFDCLEWGQESMTPSGVEGDRSGGLNLSSAILISRPGCPNVFFGVL